MESPLNAQRALEQAFLYLLYDHDRNGGAFYAHMMLRMNRHFSPNYPAVAGVNIKNAHPQLYINTEMFPLFSPKGRAGIIQHEIEHLILLHIPRAEGKHEGAWNMAADFAINSINNRIPREEESSEVFRKIYKELYDALGVPEKQRGGKFLFPEDYNLPVAELAEWYYEQIMKDENLRNMADKLRRRMMGGGTGGQSQGDNPFNDQGSFYDSHQAWKDSDKMSKDLHEAIVRDIVTKTIQKTRGDCPAHLQEYINELLRSKINWRQALRQFIARSKRAFRLYTWKRPSKRFPDAKGTRKDRMLNAVIFIDTSGSITSEELALFFGEIQSIAEQTKCEITVVEIDAEVQNVWKYKRGMMPKKGHGRGGTDFRPAFKWIEEQREKFDCAIYLTDSYGPAPAKQPLPTLWAITSSGWHNKDNFCSWGTKIKLELKEEIAMQRR